jgi:protein pelota
LRVVKVSPLKRFVTLVPETSLDLLNVYMVLEAGDMLYTVTGRELKKERRDGSVDSERVWVEVGVELLEKRLDPMTKRLDLHGVIRFESRDLGLVGKHHTIHLGVGDELTIESRKNYPRLEAVASYYRKAVAGKPVGLVLVDDMSVRVYEVTDKGLRTVFQRSVESGKEEPESRVKDMAKMYGEAVKKLEAVEGDLYVFGPSVIVDEFLNFLRKTSKELAGRVKKTGYVSDTSEAGVSELLRSRALHSLREYVKTVADVEDVEELVEVLACEPSRAALGFGECLAAVRMRAAEKLLVAEDFLWNSLGSPEVAELLKNAEESRVEVRVVSSGGEASEKLLGLGGIACILRYPVEPSALRLSG